MIKAFAGLVGLTATGVVVMSKTKNEYIWENVSMPLIRKMDPEVAHRMAVKLAAYGLVPSFPTPQDDKEVLKTSLFGLDFDSPIGLAAGFDKHGECVDGMLKMGFGFVEVGSITPEPQDGNPKPRLFRLVEDDAVINRYGFNSFGMESAYERLSKRKHHKHNKGIVSINLGKNKTTENAAEDYVKGVLKLGDLADMLVINVSSPNTPGLRKMQGREQLAHLVETVLEARSKLKTNPPLLVKIAPDLTFDDKKDIAAVLTDPKTKVDGLIVSNTTITRPESLQSIDKTQAGGLSGKPLKELSTQCIKDMFDLTDGSIPIIGVGGIASGEDAYEKICSGASLVQLYSSLSLHGPPIVRKVKRELATLLKEDGFDSVKEAVGCDVIPFGCPGTPAADIQIHQQRNLKN